MLSEEDKESEELQNCIHCMFEDFDVDCDGKLVSDKKKVACFLIANIPIVL